jgi:hypothetical protein
MTPRLDPCDLHDHRYSSFHAMWSQEPSTVFASRISCDRQNDHADAAVLASCHCTQEWLSDERTDTSVGLFELGQRR